MLEEPVQVSYGLKELLQEIRREISDGFREFRGSVGDLQKRVAELERERDVRNAEEKVAIEHEGRFLTRGQRRWAVVYAILTLVVLTFGPSLATKLVH